MKTINKFKINRMSDIKQEVNMYFTVRFEVFTAVKIQVKIFWVVTLCSVVFQRTLLLQWQQNPLKQWYLTPTLHGNTTPNTST
jgi:hypothetical protein